MTIQVVKGCPLPAGQCVGCGNYQPPDKDVIDMDVDVNWGDNLYLCQTCVGVAAGLLGFEHPDVVAKIRADLDQAESAHKAAVEERGVLQQRIDRMLDGAKAKGEAKKARKQ